MYVCTAHQKRQIASLYTFLGAIRRPYLDISSKGRYSTSDWKDEDENELDTESTKDDAFAKWQHIHALTDAERDEIDFQVKLMIKKCLESVQELERGEKRRSRWLTQFGSRPWTDHFLRHAGRRWAP